MTAQIKRCQRCILPRDYPALSFNEQGVCEFCTSHRETRYLGSGALKARITSILDAHHDRDRTYDCLLGFSGGRDSTYLLYQLTKVMGLRVLAYCADNTFLPPVAERNMKSVTRALGVDLVVERHPYLRNCLRHFMLSWIRRPSAASISTICTGCRLGIHRGVYLAAKARKIPVVVTGGSPLEVAVYKTNLIRGSTSRKGAFSIAKGYLSQIARNPRLVLRPGCVATQMKEFYYYFFSRRVPQRNVDFISPFYRYLHWKEAAVNRTIQDELGWEPVRGAHTTWKADCVIASVKAYMYRTSLGFDDEDDHLSWLVRDNQIGREEALDRLQRDRERPTEAIRQVLSELNVKRADFERALSRAVWR